ncbi:MAG: hypothetical protein HFJ27_04325, partial [Clostridia bacterium]|nr:hypothetical protein [Clostridia bacterium]
MTSVATILSGFGFNVNPAQIAADYPKDLPSISSLVRSYGLSCTKKYKPTQEEVLAHLRTGNPVIVYTDPPDRNYWTKNKHFFPVLEVQG